MSDTPLAAVDAARAFAVRPDVAWVAVGDEVVVYRVIPPTSFVLNAVAGLLWRCLDGASPLTDILADIADAFGVDTAAVEHDCLPVVGMWLEQRLVEEVGNG